MLFGAFSVVVRRTAAGSILAKVVRVWLFRTRGKLWQCSIEYINQAGWAAGHLCLFSGLCGARSVVRILVVLASVVLAGFALGGCASTDATGGSQAYASAKPKSAAKPTYKVSTTEVSARDPWTMRTPFGILYSETPRQTVAYQNSEPAGTIIVDTRNRYLYYILAHDQAIRYSIAVGKEGYSWAGVSTVSQKREWPDWTPTPAILKENPDLPRHVDGGYDNPLGARALYLGATLYRIHGTNEPWRIGAAVSSGCIRLSNNDIIDLYNRAKLGAKVIVRR
jgi:lipoprotein-anchoring transpeptidase ErfK/SrfK